MSTSDPQSEIALVALKHLENSLKVAAMALKLVAKGAKPAMEGNGGGAPTQPPPTLDPIDVEFDLDPPAAGRRW